MSEATIPVVVHILGKEYRIACTSGEEEALLESARYLDERMREVKQMGKVIGADRIAVLVALNLVTDLLKQKGSLRETGAEVISRRIRAMQQKIEGAIEEARPYI